MKNTGDNIIQDTKQFIRFKVGSEVYGVPIDEVQEIIRKPEITPLPGSQSFIKGIINLRGHIIPVIDMRERLKAEQSQNNEASVRVIVTLINEKFIGLIVDSVSQVLVLKKSEIEEPPEIINGLAKEFIIGIGKTKEEMIIILKLSRILNAKEIIAVSNVSKNK